MITETRTSQGKAAITSDKWHVVHSHFKGGRKTAHPFARTIISEHANRADCDEAASRFRSTLPDGAGAVVTEQDEVLVRPPNFKSLKSARRRKPTTK
jgi:hypothetical protein